MSAQPDETPAPHTTAARIAEFEHRTDEAVHAGSQRAIDKQHAKGKMTARERIAALLDDGSFVELDALARHRAHDFGMEENRPYGDGVVTGYGTVDGRQVCVFSQDFTVFGGSLGEVFGEKICKVMDLALKTGCPVVGINDSGGARIQEGVVALGLYGEIFYRNVMASGVIPQISLVMGPCAGGAVYSPAITDFTMMVDQTSHMFITGPDVIKTVTGEDVTMEDLGGARTHNTKSGVAHFMSADEPEALELTRALLSFLPSNNMEQAPSYDDEDLDTLEPDDFLDTFIPDSSNQPYDITTVIEHVVDDGDFLRGACAVRAEHRLRLRPGRRALGRCRRQPADAVRRHPRHRRVGEGGAVRADLRRVQHPGADLRRRPRLPARHRRRSGTASSAAAPSCSTPTPRRPSRRSRSSRARPTAARTTSWARSTCAPTSTSPGRPPRSP